MRERRRADLPNLWVVLPVLGACLVAVLAGAVTGLMAAIAIERPLRALSAVVVKIAGGDRCAIVPEQPKGPLSELAEGAETLRQAVIEADALVVDQKRREAEARLHHAGRSFFTRRFRAAVDEVTNVFADGSERIGDTAADLAERNKHMHVKVASASDAARVVSEDVAEIAVSARGILARIKRSAGDIGASRAASDRAAADLASADETVRRLAQAAARIGEVVSLIQSVARTASALQQVNASVGLINEADAKLRAVFEQQSAELDVIALRASNVAGQVAGALPDIKSAVGHVDQAGESVLGTAEEMVGQAQGLVATVDRYFTDLDHGAIRVGVLHSLSGTMTASERPLQELLVMLIEQCNAEGGLLGRPLEAVIMDPRSDARAYALQARKFLVENKVAAIFGCWTSASRKEVLPVVEELNGLLFYPSQYEGEEESPNIFYTGATPQQQAIPAVDYLRGLRRKRFFLLGTDTVYPRTTNAILKSYLDAHGITGDAVAEFYTPFNHKNWEDTVSWIHRFREGGDAAIVTTVSGDANIYFYRELARQGITAESMPAMTLSIGEGELPAIAGPEMAGHLAAWSYLHAIDSPENRAFVAAWRKFCGAPNVVTDDPMEATWISFNLWKEAVTRAGQVDVDHVRRALSGLRLRAPSGFEVFMDHANHHLHKPVVIGRITPDARIVQVWMSDHLIAPEPWSPWLNRAGSPDARLIVSRQ